MARRRGDDEDQYVLEYGVDWPLHCRADHAPAVSDVKEETAAGTPVASSAQPAPSAAKPEASASAAPSASVSAAPSASAAGSAEKDQAVKTPPSTGTSGSSLAAAGAAKPSKGAADAADGKEAAAAASASAAPAAEPTPKQGDKKQAAGQFAAWMRSAGRYVAGKADRSVRWWLLKASTSAIETTPTEVKMGAPPAGVSYPQPIARNVSRTDKRAVLRIPIMLPRAERKRSLEPSTFRCAPTSNALSKSSPSR